MSNRSEDELLRIVGVDRASHSPEAVARAEAALKALAGASRSESQDQLRTAARISFLFGLACVAVPLLMLQDPMFPENREPPWVRLAGLVQGVVGLVLVAGGIGLWRRKAWGRVCVVLVLWLTIAYTVGFGVFAGIEAAGSAPIGVRVAFALGIVGMTALWVVILRRGISYVSQPGFISLLEPGK